MVEPVHPFQGGVFHGIDVPPGPPATNDLGLVQANDHLGQGVVVRIAAAADRRFHTGLGQSVRVADGQVLAAPVAVMNQALGARPRPQGLLQRVQDQVGPHDPGDPPADDPAGKHIDDKGHVDEPGPGGDIRKIRDPQLIRARRRELALDFVRRVLRGRVRHGRTASLAAHRALCS